MNQSSILGPSGNRMVELGSQSSWLIRQKGDIVCTFQWLDIGDESGEPQPCMCLYPVNKRMESGAYVLPQSETYRFADTKGNPTPHLMGSAFKAATAMGFFPDKSTIHRIMDIVVDGISDLVKMPSYVPTEVTKKGPIQGIEVTLKAGDKVIHEALV
jgi:hypothetical protein